MILLDAVGAYLLAGVVVAVAFLVFGVSRVLPHQPVTAGARLLLLPGAIVLWPLILGRWLKLRENR